MNQKRDRTAAKEWKVCLAASANVLFWCARLFLIIIAISIIPFFSEIYGGEYGGQTLPSAAISSAGIATSAAVSEITLSAISPAAVDGTAPYECRSARDFAQFLQQDSGGTAVLCEDIICDEVLSGKYYDVSQPAVVRMGRYSIRIPSSAALYLSGPIRFERGTYKDEYENKPDVSGNASQNISDSTPEATLGGTLEAAFGDTSDTVSGDTSAVPSGNTADVPFDTHSMEPGLPAPLFIVDGYLAINGGEIHLKEENSTAILVRRTDSLFFENLDLSDSEIFVEGANAAAVEIAGENSATLCRCQIRASGKNTVGIRAEGPVFLELCSITADRTAVSSKSGQAVLDGCLVSPLPHEATVISRKAVPFERIEQNGICVFAGAAQEELDSKLSAHQLIPYILFNPDNEADSGYLHVSTAASWRGLPDELDTPGRYLAVVTPSLPVPWFPIELPVLSVPIRVINPSAPAILYAEQSGDSVLLSFSAALAQAEEVELQYAVGDGPWIDAETLSETYVTNEDAVVGPLEINHVYRFRLSVTGGPAAGVSDELEYRFYDSYSKDSGGDRDGDDRDDQGELPGTEVVPPTDGNSDSSHGDSLHDGSSHDGSSHSESLNDGSLNSSSQGDAAQNGSSENSSNADVSGGSLPYPGYGDSSEAAEVTAENTGLSSGVPNGPSLSAADGPSLSGAFSGGVKSDSSGANSPQTEQSSARIGHEQLPAVNPSTEPEKETSQHSDRTLKLWKNAPLLLAVASLLLFCLAAVLRKREGKHKNGGEGGN